MHKGKTYLECLTRENAQKIWIEALIESRYLINRPIENIPVDEALGRVMASCVYALQSVPHYNGAAMDGIAVRSYDTYGANETEPRKLTLMPLDAVLPEGCCMIVDTGDLLPTGADAVIMIEDVHLDSNSAEIMAAAASGTGTAAGTGEQHLRAGKD